MRLFSTCGSPAFFSAIWRCLILVRFADLPFDGRFIDGDDDDDGYGLGWTTRRLQVLGSIFIHTPKSDTSTQSCICQRQTNDGITFEPCTHRTENSGCCSKEHSQTVAIESLITSYPHRPERRKSCVFQPASPSDPGPRQNLLRCHFYISCFWFWCSTCSTRTSTFPFSSSIEKLSLGSTRSGRGLPRIRAQTALQHELAKRASISSRVRPEKVDVSERKDAESTCQNREKLTLRLRHAKERPNPHADQNGSEEKVRSIPQVGNHIRRRARDDEGSQPGVGRRQRHAQHADVQREGLGRPRPRDPLPGGADDVGVEVDGCHGHIAGGAAGGGPRGGGSHGVVFHHVAADVEHAGRGSLC